MTFQKFWPLYLQAHRLPGTRLLHYVATAVGIMAAIEAIAAHQPLIFVAGICLSYLIAIGAHWFIEGNQPLIRVNAFWGAIADLRMCWLAISGRLGAEFERLGVRERELGGVAGIAFPFGASASRAMLTLASAVCLTIGLADLYDLIEPMGLAYPTIQVGAPIIAFSAALLAACSSHLHARRRMAVGVSLVAMPGGGGPAPATPSELSLMRACPALLALGLAAFGLAELVEHGVPSSIYAAAAVLCLVALFAASMILALQPASGLAGDDAAGPATRGLRVDGRAGLVDALENLISVGQRRHILEATLAAAALRSEDRLLDVGCGTGELAIMAAGRGVAAVTGIDATPRMIAIARRKAHAARRRVRFEVAVAEALPVPDGSADTVTSSFLFHHLPSEVKREALREMWRVLSPGGRLVLTDYGRPRSVIGLMASLPMRLNFHEHVRPQLGGELERLIEGEGLGKAEVVRVFLGYITVLRLVKPRRDSSVG